MTDRIPPYSEEAERGLLGSILIDFDVVLELCSETNISSASFYIPAHRMIFDAIVDLDQNQRPIDMLTVGDELRRKGQLDQAGGQTFLSRLVDGTPTTSHAKAYLDIVQGKALLRQLIVKAREVENAVYNEAETPEQLRAKAEYEFAQLLEVHDSLRTAPQMYDIQADRWETAQEKGCAGIQTGFRIFDVFFGGLLEAATYYLSGGAGSAKTTLARNVSENLAMCGHPVGFFTLEQTGEQVWGAVGARYSKQSVFLLNQGLKDRFRSNVDKIREARDIVTKWPLYIDDRPQTPTTLWTHCRRGVAKHGWELIVLDYLQLLDPDQNYKTEESKYASYSATLRRIAKTLRVPVLVISALSREKKLRGSGMLDYDCWAHLRLEKCEDWPTRLEIDVHFEKQRFGPPANQEILRLVGDEQRLEEPGGTQPPLFPLETEVD